MSDEIPRTKPLLELSGISKSFFGVQVLREVDLDLHPGEVHAVVGENGAGKSTLMKIVAGAYRPGEGDMRVDGEAVAFHSVRGAQQRGIGIIFQEFTLLPERTVAQNIFLGREPSQGLRVDRRAMANRTRELLSSLGVEGLSSRAVVGTLSVAQQQIVEIAKALSLDPRILVMDEPTADAAEFLVDNVDSGGNILALRILPGVDVLETRWSAGKEIFDDSDLNVVGVEFTEGDAARVKSIVSDYIQRFGTIDGVWMDAGATSVAAAEAFEDNGMEVPPITGEDQNDYLTKWEEDGLTALAPTYPTYQWRTAVLAATQILSGEEVPKEWVLPQPKIDESTLGEYVAPDMPPLFYALCGCQEMDGFPQRWSE